MNIKKAIKTVNILLLTVICSMEVIGQCPNILTTNIDNNGLCTGDSFTISIFGIDLPDGGTIDYFLSPSSGFDAYEGEGDYIGSADITTPCTQGPTILFALIDAPTGPDRCDEFIAFHSGSGMSNVDDLIINSNFGFSPYVSGNPNNFSGCVPTVLNPGEPIPPNVIVVVQGAFNTENGDIYDITSLCNSGLPVYVLASANTNCGGGHYTNTGTFTYGVETPCGDDSFTYTGASNPSGTTWDNVNGYTTGSHDVENIDIPDYIESPSTVTNFVFTIDENFCDDYGGGIYYVEGIINPTPSTFCSPLETTTEIQIVVFCDEYVLTSAEICDDVAIFDLDQLLAPPGPGLWAGSGLPIIGSDLFPEGLAPGIYTVSFTPSAGECNEVISTTIEIIEAPSVAIDIDISNICLLPGSTYEGILISGTQPGGVWSISPSGSIDPGTGIIDNNSLTGGVEYTITYTLTEGACTSSASESFTPLDSETVNLDPFPEICNQSSPIPLNTTQDGFTGEWSGPGVNLAGNSFNPNGLIGVITLTFTPDDGQCAEANSIDVTVVDETEVIISGVPTLLCSADPNIDLPIFQSGVQGTWSGTNVINNVFDPSGLSGSVFLQFEPNFGQCGETPPPFEIEIIPTPDAFDIGPLIECGDENMMASFDLSSNDDDITGGADITTVTWFSDPGLSIPVPNPSDFLVTGSAVVYAVVSLNGCNAENIVAIDLIVSDGLEFEINPNPGLICEEESTTFTATITNGGPADLTWEGPGGITLFGLEVEIDTEGTYVVTADDGACVSEPVIFEVTTSPPIIFTDIILTDENCGQGDGSIEIVHAGGTGELTFFWSGFPLENSSILSNLSAGEYSVTMEDEVGCILTIFFLTVGNSGEIDFEDVTNPATCGQSNGNIEILPNGNPPYTINWSNGENTLSIDDLSPGTYNFTLTNGLDCTITEEIEVSEEGTTAELSMTSPNEYCEGDDVTITFNFISGEAPFVVVYSINGIIQPELTFNQNQFDHEITITENSIIEVISYTADDCAGATLPDNLEIDIFPPLEISDLNLICDGSNDNYIVSFQISGGSGNTIEVTPNEGTLDQDGLFTSEPIEIGSDYSFSVFEMEPCAPIIVSGPSIVNCNCLSSAATMPTDPIVLCEDESITVDPSIPGVVVDPDIFQYILHDNAGNSIGNEILRTIDPTISFDEALGMMFGTTYYLSFVVGPDDGSGNVDLDNECASVSFGTPITWYEQITMSFENNGPYCEDDVITVNLVFDGAGPYIINYTLDDVGQTPITTSENPYIFNISELDFDDSMEIISLNAATCPGILDGSTVFEYIEEMSFSNLVIECNNGNETYVVSFDVEGGLGDIIIVNGDGNLTGNTFTSNPISNGQPYQFDLTSIDGCDLLIVSGVDDCQSNDCQGVEIPISLVNTDLSICPGTFVVVELNLENPSSEYSFRWNVPYAPFVISGYPLNASAGGDYSVVVTDQETGCESDTLFFSIVPNASPMVTSFERICDEENDFYTIVFEISGGNELNYMVSPPASGILSGNVFTSNPIAVGTDYNFTISDGGLCIPPPVSGNSPTCNDCNLEAGVMDGTPINVCYGEDLNLNYLGGYNGVQGVDSLFFVLSTNPNPIGSSIWFFSSATIPWDELIGLAPIPGQVYYVSAVAAPIDGDEPDLMSECVSISNATSFTISPEAILTIVATEQLCQDEPLIIQFNYTGPLPYTITFEQDGIIRTYMGLTTNSVLVLDPGDFSESIVFTGVEGSDGCSGNLDGNLIINKVPPIEIGEVTFDCDLVNGTYQVVFPITGITSPDFIVCGQFGVINAGVFYSIDIPLDVGYNICITNSFGCDTIDVSGLLPECEECEVEAGQITGDELQIFCTSNPNSVFTITRTSTGFSGNPGEVIRFYLVRNFPITGPSDIISNSLTPSFSINNPTINQSYFVYGIAGENDGTGFPDLDSDCLDTTNIIEIIFYRNVVRDIIVDLCPGGEFVIDGQTFDIDNPAGSIVYEGMASNGCDSILMIQLEFNAAIDSLYQDVLCSGESINLNGTIFNENNPDGEIILNANASGDCDTIINVMLSFLPPAVSVENIVLCEGESITIGGVEYNVDNPTGEILIENGSVNGCDSLAQIFVEFTTLDIDILTMNTECTGVESGSISLFDNNSSGSMFEVIVNNTSVTTDLPFDLLDLGAGQYDVRVIQGQCSWDSIVNILPENTPVLSLGQTIQATAGEIVQINGEANFIPVDYNWSPSVGLSCLDCLNPLVTVDGTVTYMLTIADVNGCTATSQVSIIVEEPTIGVYIPNSFSPNFDGYNDEFLLYADENYISEYKMSIFNRWGDLVYSAEGLQPRSITGAWNGTFNGKRLSPDVYVYMIEATIAGTNEVKVYAGDITLLQ